MTYENLGDLLVLVGVLGGICGLLAGVSFNSADRQKYPILRILDEKRLHLLIVAIVFLALTAPIYKWKESVKPALELSQGPGGEQVEKATTSGFKKELEEAAAELVSEAEDYFKAGERDFAERRYRDAAGNYQKSIDVIPTMSGYLNRGISLYYISDFIGAEGAFNPGLQIALKKRNREFEGAFLGSIGLVYADQGKLEEALKYHQQALEIHKQIGNPLGQAADLNNIGIVYFNQGKAHEALELLKEARAICLKIGAKTQLRIVEETIKRLEAASQ